MRVTFQPLDNTLLVEGSILNYKFRRNSQQYPPQNKVTAIQNIDYNIITYKLYNIITLTYKCHNNIIIAVIINCC